MDHLHTEHADLVTPSIRNFVPSRLPPKKTLKNCYFASITPPAHSLFTPSFDPHELVRMMNKLEVHIPQ